MTLKFKDKKLFRRNCILDNFKTRKFNLYGVFLWIKDPDPDPGDPKRPDPTGSGSATLVVRRSSSRILTTVKTL